MLRMMLLGLLIPLGVGVLAAMELNTPARNAVVVVQSPADTTVGISDLHGGALAKADRLEIAAASSEAPAQPALEHDPEKWVPAFPRDKHGTRLRGDHAQIKEMERDDDSKKRHHALIDERISPSEGIKVGASEPRRVINRHRHEAKSKKVTTARSQVEAKGNRYQANPHFRAAKGRQRYRALPAQRVWWLA